MKVKVNAVGDGYRATIVSSGVLGVKVLDSKSHFMSDKDAVVWAIDAVKAYGSPKSVTIEFEDDIRTRPSRSDTKCNVSMGQDSLHRLSFVDIAKIRKEIPESMVASLIDKTMFRVSLERRRAGELADKTFIRDIVVGVVGCTKEEVYANAVSGKLDMLVDYNGIMLRSFEKTFDAS